MIKDKEIHFVGQPILKQILRLIEAVIRAFKHNGIIVRCVKPAIRDRIIFTTINVNDIALSVDR